MNLSGQPSASPSNAMENQAMHVTLLAQSDDSECAALPKGNQQPQGRMSNLDLAKMLRLIESVCCAKDRDQAIQVILSQLTTYFPDNTIRCGIGEENLQKVFDLNLGWLGRESTIFTDSEQRWQTLQSQSDNSDSGEASLVVSIPQRDGDGRCAIWIDGPDVAKTRHQWLTAALPTLSSVYWDRPKHSWYRAHEKIGLVGAYPWMIGAMIIFTAIALWPVKYRVACDAQVQPVRQRMIATPFEATLLETNVQPGDHVKSGDVLVHLDGRPLRLELESISTEIQQAAKEHNIALHTSQIADAQQAKLRKRGLERRRDILTDRLNRLNVVSPIDGVIVSGDLQQYIGSPLEIGQTIVEIAPLDKMAFEIEIPEFEIGLVEPNAETRVRVGAIGGESYRSNIDVIYPAAEIRNDKSVFVARVEVDNTDGKLRPGMQGDAVTYGPVRPQIWSWVRGSWEKILWSVGY